MIRWLQTFPYFLREALKDFRENTGVALIAVVTTTISLMFLGSLWIVHLNLGTLIDAWRERFQLTVFLSDRATPDEREALRRVLLSGRAVERIEEVSPAQALAEFREWLGKEADILAGLDGDALPASIRVILRPGQRDLAHVEALMGQIRRMPGIERTRNDLAWLRRLEDVIRLIRLAVWTLSGLLGLGVVFIIANTIRLTLFARREDIAVMHLVGATDPFIKTPYVTEGVLCGALSGLLAFLALLGLFHGFFQPLVASYSAGGFGLDAGGGALALGLAGAGGALGFVGSAISVRHFLRGARGR